MAGSRAMKEITTCSPANERRVTQGGSKEKVGQAVGTTKQYHQTGKKYTGPNYPQDAGGIVVPKTGKGL